MATIKDINETIGKINEGASGLGINANLPTLNTSVLNEGTQRTIVPEQPRTVEAPAVDEPPTSQSATDSATSVASPYDTASLQKTAQEDKKSADLSFDELLASFSEMQGKTELTATAEEKAGLPQANKDLQDINDQIRNEKRRLENEVRDIQDNREGLFGSAVSDKITEARDKSYRRQADMAVIQQSLQGKYNSAKTIADRAVKIQTERQQAKIDALTLTYERNKDLFTESEKRAFESAQADRKRKLDEETKTKQDISDLSLNALTNGAPPSVAVQMRNAKTIEEAILIGGQYIDSQQRTINALKIKQLKEEVESEPDEKLTSAQYKARGFGTRMLDADKTISEFGEKFTGTSSYIGKIVPNVFKSEERQQYEQAQRNFVNAVLRQESGAAISEEEFDNARLQYFPQPGDSQGVIIQKKQNRNIVIKNMLAEGKVDTSTIDTDDPLGLNINVNTTNPLEI